MSPRLSLAADAPAASNDPGRGRLVELFIWKTSEELKLPTQTEIKYGEALRKLSDRRKANGDRLERAIRQLDKVSSKPLDTSKVSGKNNVYKDLEPALTEYKKTVAELHKIQDDELKQMSSILGPVKFARYLVVKSEITEKLKTFLSHPEQSPAPASGQKDQKMDAPKVIEEK